MLMAIVRFSVEGWHYWPEAHENRRYLRNSHRHVFEVEAQIELRHAEREIEFHDFLMFCKLHFPTGDLGPKSCETLATDLAKEITRTFPGRVVRVTVMEDGENGASVFLVQSLQ